MLQLKRDKRLKLPEVSTASLPDIVFILLFFFMTVTTIKNQQIMVENNLPLANETEQLNKKDRIIEIFIGQIKSEHTSLGQTMVQLQLDDRLVDMDEIGHQALMALNTMPEHIRKTAIVSIKADHKVKMGVIADVKKQLRTVNLLKINYTTVEGSVFQDF